MRVGIIDTGVDGTHPDIAPNFDARPEPQLHHRHPGGRQRRRRSTGRARSPSCVDPPNVDDDGHGTHVASTIASPVNGFGIAGVAPKATIVNLRAGQDSGYFFLQPSVDALTYAGDHGIDVVNMSYYVDPWLFNCANNPADSPEDQAEQRDDHHRDAARARLRAPPRRHARRRRPATARPTTRRRIVDASSPDFAVRAR